jgi:hypothetical protein
MRATCPTCHKTIDVNPMEKTGYCPFCKTHYEIGEDVEAPKEIEAVTKETLQEEFDMAYANALDARFYAIELIKRYKDSYLGYFDLLKWYTNNFSTDFNKLKENKELEVITKDLSVEVWFVSSYEKMNFDKLKPLFDAVMLLGEENSETLSIVSTYYHKIYLDLFHQNKVLKTRKQRMAPKVVWCTIGIIVTFCCFVLLILYLTTLKK